MDIYKIDYSEENKKKIEQILANLSGVPGIRLSLISDKLEKRLEASLTTEEYTYDQLTSIINYIISSSEMDTKTDKMDSEIAEIYHKFEELDIEESVEFRIENDHITLHTSSEDLRRQLESIDAVKENDGFVVTDETISALRKQSNKEDGKETEKESEITEELLPSKVNIYEKIVQDKMGNNIISRISIVKQNKEDSQYDRLVTMSFVGKDNQVLTTPEVIGYENGPDFDNNILPSILDGYTKNVTLSGNEVDADEKNSTNIAMTTENGQEPIHNYSVTGNKSISQVMAQNNMNESIVDLDQLIQNGTMEEKDSYYQTFEENVTENKQENSNELDQESLEKEMGRPYMKKLTPPDHFGLGTINSFTMFIIIDLIAMAVGILLLLS